MMMEGDLIWCAVHAIQYTDDVSYNCIPETYAILLNHAT